MNENQHVESDSNEHAGDRPLRKHFNRTIIVVLAIMALAMVAAWAFIGLKGRNTPGLGSSAPHSASAILPAR